MRGSLHTILALRLVRPEDPDFFTLLLDKIAHAPDFFRNAPVLLDVSPIDDQPPIDLRLMVEQLRQHRLFVVGIQNAGPAWQEEAARSGLAVFPAGKGHEAVEQRPAAAETAPPARTAPPPAPAGPTTMLVKTPVRGGQQIVNPHGDLVVLASVGAGAELAALGHIHVYGPLRGRAFAGIDGDEQAMIFCDQLHAELLSIAGVHVVNEELDELALGKRVRVSCDGEGLVVQPAD